MGPGLLSASLLWRCCLSHYWLEIAVVIFCMDTCENNAHHRQGCCCWVYIYKIRICWRAEMNEGGETRLQRLHVGLILKNRQNDTNNTSVANCERQKLRETIQKYRLVILPRNVYRNTRCRTFTFKKPHWVGEQSVTFFSLQICCLFALCKKSLIRKQHYTNNMKYFFGELQHTTVMVNDMHLLLRGATFF